MISNDWLFLLFQVYADIPNFQKSWYFTIPKMHLIPLLVQPNTVIWLHSSKHLLLCTITFRAWVYLFAPLTRIGPSRAFELCMAYLLYYLQNLLDFPDHNIQVVKNNFWMNQWWMLIPLAYVTYAAPVHTFWKIDICLQMGTILKKTIALVHYLFIHIHWASTTSQSLQSPGSTMKTPALPSEAHRVEEGADVSPFNEPWLFSRYHPEWFTYINSVKYFK